jgi:multiple sugar transport system substrate-binding protein
MGSSGRTRVTAALSLAAVLVLNACGGGAATPSPAPSRAPATATPAPTAAPATATAAPATAAPATATPAPATATAAPTDAPTVAPTATATTAAHDPVTLKLLWWFEGKFYDDLLASFQAKYPYITVEKEVVPSANFYTKLGAYIQAGDGPDVMGMEPRAIVTGYKDILQDLKADVGDLTDSITDAKAFCQDEDCSTVQWGIPWNEQGHPLYYNNAVLKEAGLDPTNLPKTQRQLDEWCTKIKAIKKQCFAVGAKDFGLLLLLSQTGLRTATTEQMQGLFTGKTKWTDPEFLAIFQLVEKMAKDGMFAEGFSAMNVAPEAQDLFVKGEAAFFQGLAGDVYHWKNLADLMGADAISVSNMPAFEQDYPIPGVTPGPFNDQLGMTSGAALVVPTWSKHKPEAVLLARYMVDAEQQGLLLTVAGSYPSLKSVDVNVVTVPAFAELVKIVNASKTPPFGVYFGTKYFDVLNAQLQLVALGQATPADAAAAVQVAADATNPKP